jgi:hypothetical protein
MLGIESLDEGPTRHHDDWQCSFRDGSHAGFEEKLSTNDSSAHLKAHNPSNRVRYDPWEAGATTTTNRLQQEAVKRYTPKLLSRHTLISP